tara:strand:- start:1100 stop:1843 length:744 start_codon:yes stop_codon:yes gene_type:complete
MKLQIEKVKDDSENFYTPKEVIGDLPCRCLIVGRSHISGKSNLAVNLLCKDEFYNKDFLGKNIFIVSKSCKTDPKLLKLIKFKEIPSQNVNETFDEDYLQAVFELIEEEHEQNKEKKKKVNYAFMFDDISFKGDLKNQNGVLSLIFSNGRHSNISVLPLTSQRYSDIATSARENASMGFFFACSDRQLESINNDWNLGYGNKRQFKKMFMEITREKHSFLFVCLTNPADLRFLNSDFQPVPPPENYD